MSVKVVLSVGEDYPHLFTSTDPGDIEWGETAEGSEYRTIVELTDQEWAEYQQARNRYYELAEKLAQRLTGRMAQMMRS